MLTAAEVDSIVRAEIAEREQAADDYAARGRPDQAERLRCEAAVLATVMSGAGAGS